MSNQYLMETEPGLSIKLGSVAFRANTGIIGVSLDEIVTHGHDGAGAQGDQDFNYNHGLFDFSISGLPVAGQSVRVVIAQLAAIPVDAAYRKLMPSGWQYFEEDANNALASAPGEAGICPPPGDVAYLPGLTEGDWCVQLTIEDGGANDADGSPDGTVRDPGGVTAEPVIASVTGNGGGAFSGNVLMLMSLILLWRLRRQRALVGTAVLSAAALLGASQVQAENSLMPSYAGISYLSAKSDESSDDFNSELAALSLNASVHQSDLTRSGYSAYIGYPLNDSYAVEIGYLDLGESSVSIAGPTADINTFLNTTTSVYPVTAKGWTLAMVASGAITDKVSLLAKVGVFAWNTDYTLSSATSLRSFDTDGGDIFLGLAIESELMPGLPVRFGWTNYRLDNINVGAWELGVAYLF